MITEADARGPSGQQFNPPFRVGIVDAQQLTPFPAVRVKFPDRDNVISYWLHVASRGSQNDKEFWMPDLGEQVLCIMDEHDEYGSVVGSLGNTTDTSPSFAAVGVRGFEASDGAVVTYDRNTHTLLASLPTGSTVNVVTAQGSKVVLGSDGTALMQDAAGAYVKATNDGTVHVNGNLLVAGTISTTAGTWGDGHGTITGSLSATGEVTAGSGGADQVGLQTHTHPGVQSGGSNTASPNAGT
jgi:phage baseplate assembly protein V